jgi:hypothetical protein
MADYRLQSLSRVKLSPVNENQGLDFHLTFQSSKSRQDTVQFQLSSNHAMAILNALMGMQRKFGWPLPAPSQPYGAPFLRVVVDNSENE